MNRYFLVIVMALVLVGCGTSESHTTTTVHDLRTHFVQEGFTFTELPAEGFEAPLGPRTIGISEDGFVQVQIYGETIPNRVALTVSGLPERNRTDVYFPDMVTIAQGLVPEWGDASQWLNTQIGFGQNQIQNVAREQRGNYEIVFSSTQDVLNLIMTIRDPAKQ